MLAEPLDVAVTQLTATFGCWTQVVVAKALCEYERIRDSHMRPPCYRGRRRAA